MTWWSWIVLGLALLVIEIVTPGALFAVFFGFGALVVSALVSLGIAGPPTVQWLVFTIVSVATLAVVRRRLQRKLATTSGPELVGEVAIPLQDLAPRDAGKAELRGTCWNARNAADAALLRGQRCHVVRVEGLTLWIAPE
jgi:membrane protein implicated in regulation of membrane protease activity